MRQQPQQSFEPRTRRTLKAAAGALLAVGALALGSTGCGTTAAETPQPVATAPKLVRVALLSPSAGTVSSAGRITVRGTVSPANATVLVQGRPAAVGNGVFTATATVHRGRTTIDVIATAAGATPGSARVAVSRPRSKARPAPAPAVTVATVGAGRRRSRAPAAAATACRSARTRPARSRSTCAPPTGSTGPAPSWPTAR